MIRDLYCCVAGYIFPKIRKYVVNYELLFHKIIGFVNKSEA